jgi:hypothetical protein
MTKVVEYASFKLSRIYAQGWNAGRRLDAGTGDKTADELNPHTSEPERSRWNDGFIKASE